MKKLKFWKNNSLILTGVLIGLLTGGGYLYSQAIQSQVGIAGFNTALKTWRYLRVGETNADGSATTDTGALVTQSRNYIFNTGTGLYDRWRGASDDADALAVTALGSGRIVSNNFVFNGTTWDRSRSASIGDSAAITGVSANLPFFVNSLGTLTRQSSAARVGATNNGDNLHAAAIYAFDAGNSQSQRVHVNSNGRVFTLTTSRQSGINNSETTGAANTAVTVTLVTSATQSGIINKVTARCSAGTASITVTNGVAQIWSTPAGAVGTSNFTEEWTTGLTSAAGNDPVITLTTCGAGNTGTLAIQSSIDS